LLAVGLIARRREGEGCYDRFRHRLIFPILDAMSRPIAFGARRLRETDEPKYLNSPESPIFDKSATLFGLHAAKRPIIAARRAVIVEGYTDVTAAHQAGQTNVLATLGTALTAGHARQLRRYAEQIVLVFDGDEAGHKAAERALAVFLNEPVDVRIAVLPAGVDPADLLAGPDGAERWREMIDRAQDVLNFRFAQLREALHDRDSVAGRQQAAERMITQLHELGLTRQDPLRRGLILDRLAEVLGLDGSEVRRVVDRLAPRDRPPRRDAAPSDGDGSASGDGRGVARDAEPAVSGAVRRAERQILGLLLQDENWFHAPTDDGRSIDEAAPPEDFVTAEARALYSELYDRLAGGREASLASLLIAWAERGPDGEALTRLATDVVAETEAIAPDGELRAEMWRAAVATLQAHHREREAAEEAAALLRAARTPAERLAAAQRLASQRRRRATG